MEKEKGKKIGACFLTLCFRKKGDVWEFSDGD
jgi:hypothetical protein